MSMQLRGEAHAIRHFGEEDASMQGYPSAGCHVDEHAAVLKSTAEVIAKPLEQLPAIGTTRVTSRIGRFNQ